MTSFSIPIDHPSLPGHFPGRPLVPGVILLERVIEAVASECLALGLEPPRQSLRLPQVKFLHPLLPGETARIELERSAAARWRFRVLRGATLLASGEVSHAAAPGATATSEQGQ